MAPPPRNKGKKANRKPLQSDDDKKASLEKVADERRKARAQEHKAEGNTAFAAKQWLQAVELFTQAIQEDASDKVFFSNRSAANLALRRTADAVADARDCVRLAPEWAKGYSRLGAALWADRQLADAVAAYGKGLKIDGGNEVMVADNAKCTEELKAEQAEQATEKDAADVKADTEVEVVIGIDLGTTFSACAVWDVAKGGVRMLAAENGKNTVPSYVSWTADGERLIGERAKAATAKNPTRTLMDVKRIIGRKFYDEAVTAEAKRLPYKVVKGKEDRVEIEVELPQGTKKFMPEEISAMVLGKMKEIAEKELGHPVRKAVVTVPAYFNDAQRKATQAAGAIAGLDVLRIINEPTAAALGYGLDQKENGKAGANVLIFDLGGGTFDVSVLRIQDGLVEVKATGGDTRLGGEDFDACLGDHIVAECTKLGAEGLDSAKLKAKIKAGAERVKIELSGKEVAEVDVAELLGGDATGTFKVTRAEFEKLNAKLFQQTLDVVGKVMKDAKLAPDDIDDVVLVGGSTRVPVVQKSLSAYFGGKGLCKSIHPDEAVAYGAAVQGAILSGVRTAACTDMLLIDVTPLSLGIETEGRHHSIIIPRNTSIPCTRASTYTTVENYQEKIDVCVYEGERPCVDGNRLLGEFVVTGIERAKQGEAQVEVTFSLDANGVLHVAAVDKKTRARAECTINDACKGLDPAEIARMLQEAEDMKEEDDEYKRKLDLKSEIEEVAYSLGDPKSGELLDQLDELDLGETAVAELERMLKAATLAAR